LHQPGELKKAKITIQNRLFRIHVKSENRKIYEEIGALEIIPQAVPLNWFFVPFFWIAEIFGIGNKIYDWVAKHCFNFPPPRLLSY
jgi:predicted DCC family thiol-disulfide oxidoreductase YuxK